MDLADGHVSVGGVHLAENGRTAIEATCHLCVRACVCGSVRTHVRACAVRACMCVRAYTRA